MFDLTSLSLIGIMDFSYFSFSNILKRDESSIIVSNKVEVEIGIISLRRYS